MNEPIDVATAETVAFLTQYLPHAARVIEVGCGKGHVAQALADRGYRIVGLDADGETVAAAKARGAPVIQATWPEFDSAPVDAIVFTRSLHHVGDLQRAVQKARETLKPRGKLLVEDFAFEAVDEATVDWFVGVVRNAALINARASEFISELIGSDNPAATWQQHHNHEVHTVEAMKRSIVEHFEIEETSSVPYLYRYLIPTLPAAPSSVASLQRVLQDEAQRGHTGEIALIGRRLVGTSRARS